MKKRGIALLLSLVLMGSLLPAQFVTQAYAADTANRDFITLKQNDSIIAPGVTQTIATVRKKYNSQQMIYYAMTVDTKVETVHIYANYKDNEWEPHANGQYGLSTVKDQMDAAMRNHTDPSSDRYINNYTVVGGINGTGYNMSTGQTRGILVMEGHIVQEDCINSSGSPEPFFAIMKDGTPKIFWNSGGKDWAEQKNNVREAICSFGAPLIVNGQIRNSDWGGSYPDSNARTAIGVTADGKVVMLVVDGKQVESEGCDMYELALIFQAAGCVDAFNLDGGGSTTYVSRPEGESTYRVVNKPCDGSPRTVSASLMVVSTAPASDDFNRASIAADSEYITPGGMVKLTAAGISSAGTPVDIPAGVTWTVEDETGGTFTGSGASAAFTAGDSTGTVTVQMKDGDRLVGEKTIHVVRPNIFSFGMSSYALPFGKSFDLEVKAAYNSGDSEHTVTLHDGDVQLSLNPADIGTLNGYTLTARPMREGDEATVSGTLTAELAGTELTHTVPLTVGRESETLFDFEDPSIIDKLYTWDSDNGAGWDTLTYESATAADGHVHSGNRSLRVTMDWRHINDNITGSGCLQLFLGIPPTAIEGAVGVGAWMWVPDEEISTQIRTLVYHSGGAVDSNEAGTDYSHSQVEGKNYDEGHWVYLYVPVNSEQSKTAKLSYYLSILLWTNNKDPEVYKKLCNKLVFYLDDITVDYSPVHPDRDMPVIGDVKTPRAGTDNLDTLNRGEVYNVTTGNTVRFLADASDPVNSNSTGLDVNSAEAYIDGTRIGASYDMGQIQTEEVTLADGVHTLKLYISDKAGNRTNATRQFRISANSGIPTVNVVPHQPNADRILINSLFYVDVKATDISKVKSIDLKLDLINNAIWQLEHAEVDPKFSMEFSVDEYENIATLRFTRVEDWKAGDSGTIASLPIRMWGTEWPSAKLSPQEAWTKGFIPPIQLQLDVDYGKIGYQDYTSEALNIFGGANIRVDTELFDRASVVVAAYPNKTSWHLHDAPLTQVADKAATCTTDGFTGRTFCETCKSVVDWGATVSATGHTWAVGDDGKRACTGCGKLFTGEFEGKQYVDGVAFTGWREDSYYKDGVKQTAEWQTIDGKLYQFTDGACEGQKPYTGFYEQGGARYYYEVGAVQTGSSDNGWFQVDKETCHACEGKGGALGTVTFLDTRTCTQNGFKLFTCETCGKTKTSEGLWAEGHKWDIEHPVSGGTAPKCTVCGVVGKDIAKVKIEFAGSPYFICTGGEIRAAHTVTDGDKVLSITSDKQGADGLASYQNNIKPGVATLHIEGRGDYYGTVEAKFYIIPANVPVIRAAKQDKTSVTLAWDAAPGAGYYGVYWKKAADADRSENWHLAGTTAKTELKVTGLTFGETYQFRVAGRATVAGEKDPYTSLEWTKSEEVTLEHLWETTSEVPPTCTQEGSTTRKCQHCGETETTTVPVLPHTVESWSVVTQPTETGDGSEKGHCSVCNQDVTRRIPPLKQYTITAAAAGGGTLSVAESAREGAEITVTATPAEDYELVKVEMTYLNGEETVTAQVEDGKFTMPAAEVALTATFKRVVFRITVSQAQNGTVTAPAKARPGETVTVSAVPSSGYTLDHISISYEGTLVRSATQVLEGNTFIMPESDVTVSAVFRQSGGGNSGSGSSGGFSGGGTDSGSTNKPGAGTEVKNPDGSTTTTETKKDGTRIETTTKTETKTDGTKVENTATIETKKDGTKVESTATVETKKDGTKVENTTTVETKKDGTKVENITATETKSDGSAVTNAATTTTNTDGSKLEEVVETTVKPDGTKEESVKTTETKADGSVEYAAKQADGTTASATVDTAGKMEAAVVLTEKAVAAAGEKPIVLPLPEVPVVTDRESAPTVKVELPAKTETANVVIPVQKADSAAVAVIVHPDGTEEIVRKSIVTKSGLSVPLENGAMLKVVSNSKQFEDVSSHHWAADAVRFTSSHELFQGNGRGQFQPNESMTRSMMVTLLYNLEQGEADDGSAASEFTDVPDNQWYSDAISWAARTGLVSGYPNGNFGVNDKITREQMAILFYRYSGSPDVTGTLDFDDAGDCSSLARDALIWAQQNKVMQGNNGKINPKGEASRVEVAQLMMNYVNYLAGK